MNEPVIVCGLVYSDYTMIPYSLSSGESDYSIEQLPIFHIAEMPNNDIVLKANQFITKSLIPRYQSKDNRFVENYCVVGTSTAALSLLSNFKRGCKAKVTLLKLKHEELDFGNHPLSCRSKEEAKRVSDRLLNKLCIDIIEPDSVDSVGGYQNKIYYQYTDKHNVQKEFLKPFTFAMVAPKLKPYPPHNIDLYQLSRYQNFNLAEDDIPQQDINKSKHIKAYFTSASDLSKIENLQGQVHSISVFAKLFSRPNTFTQWLETKVLENVHISNVKSLPAHMKEWKPDHTIFIYSNSDYEKEKYNYLSTFGDKGLNTNIKCSSKYSKIYIGGPMTRVPCYALGKKITPLNNVQVEQGKATAAAWSLRECFVTGINLHCYELGGKRVCELGEVDRHHQIWETGNPQTDDYLGVWTNEIGMVRGARTVGTKEQYRLALLHKGMMCCCLPRVKNFFKDENQWHELRKAIEEAFPKFSFTTPAETMNFR